MRGSRATAGMRGKSNSSGLDERATEPASPSRQASRSFQSSSLRKQGPSSHSRQLWAALTPLVAQQHLRLLAAGTILLTTKAGGYWVPAQSRDDVWWDFGT